MAEEPMNELSLMVARIKGMHLTLEKATDAVQLLAQAAKTVIPGAAGAGLSLIDSDGHRVSAGATDEVVREADDLQYALGEGPCLEAWQTTRSILSNDLERDPRWPGWRDAVSELPIVSVLSTPLVAEGRCIGALKVYARDRTAFTEESLAWLELLAGAAAVLLQSIQSEDTPHQISRALEGALSSRDTVSRACGALMERHGITEEEAMRHMLAAARNGATLAEVARQVLSAPGHRERRGVLWQ
jgi:GAF domain-containing protein